MFALHRFDVGYNIEYNVKLNPDENKRVYTQSHPTAIHLRDVLLVELALMQYFNIITMLSNSRYSSPFFAQRKSNGRLRLLIDLRRVNHLLRQDCRDSNFPISNMSDATTHFAGKSLLNKFDCSQAYHCVQMADDQSIQLLPFNYSSRTYAYKCLAQGLAKSVTGFSAFIRNYLDPYLAAGSCTQLMDDIGCGVEKFEELVPNLRKIFSCIRKSGLKLAPAKCHIGTEKIKFLGKMITTEGIQPESAKVHKFLKTMKMPRTVKQVKRLIGFCQFFRNFLSNLNETLLPFYKLLKFNAEFFVNDEHVKALEKLQEKLLTATKMTLRLAKSNQQYVVLTDASYYQAGFVLMIEDYVENENTGKETKIYAPVSFGSKLFNAAQLKHLIFCKEFLAVYFAQFIWGCEKPVLVLTDNRSLTKFFQAKTVPPALWNFLDRVLSFNIVVGHIPGAANAAADFLSRMNNDPNETITLEITDRIPFKEIEVSTTAKTPDFFIRVRP